MLCRVEADQGSFVVRCDAGTVAGRTDAGVSVVGSTDVLRRCTTTDRDPAAVGDPKIVACHGHADAQETTTGGKDTWTWEQYCTNLGGSGYVCTVSAPRDGDKWVPSVPAGQPEACGSRTIPASLLRCGPADGDQRAQCTSPDATKAECLILQGTIQHCANPPAPCNAGNAVAAPAGGGAPLARVGRGLTTDSDDEPDPDADIARAEAARRATLARYLLRPGAAAALAACQSVAPADLPDNSLLQESQTQNTLVMVDENGTPVVAIVGDHTESSNTGLGMFDEIEAEQELASVVAELPSGLHVSVILEPHNLAAAHPPLLTNVVGASSVLPAFHASLQISPDWPAAATPTVAELAALHGQMPGATPQTLGQLGAIQSFLANPTGIASALQGITFNQDSALLTGIVGSVYPGSPLTDLVTATPAQRTAFLRGLARYQAPRYAASGARLQSGILALWLTQGLDAAGIRTNRSVDARHAWRDRLATLLAQLPAPPTPTCSVPKPPDRKPPGGGAGGVGGVGGSGFGSCGIPAS